MNVFAIVSSFVEETLTEDNFSEKTNRDYPYYRPELSDKCPYFAVCPKCGNPIPIINLFTETMEENKTGRRGLHAKHYGQSISGLAVYNRKEYEGCPLKAKVSLGYHQIRRDKIENERLKNLVINNKTKIYNYIREITSIYFRNKRLEEWVNDYLSKRYYEYKGADDRNLPYSILVTHHAIDLYGQKISHTDLGKEISNAIRKKSRFFKTEIVKTEKSKEIVRIVKKERIFPMPEIKMLLYNHKIQDEEETIKIKIFEIGNGKEYPLLVKIADVMDCPI